MTQDERSSIAERLRQARENAGLSQGQAAKELEMHRPTLSEIEAARRRVSAEELKQMGSLYDVSVAWIVGENSAREDGERRVRMAARELERMKPGEVKQVLELLASVKKGK